MLVKSNPSKDYMLILQVPVLIVLRVFNNLTFLLQMISRDVRRQTIKTRIGHGNTVEKETGEGIQPGIIR